MDSKRIEAFLDGKLVLDCPKIILTPCSTAPNRKSLVGAGTIAADEPGKFLLKVFFEESFSLEESFASLKWEVGKVIDSEHYYDLDARDILGNTWTSKRLLPDRSAGPNGSMIKATFQDLEHIDNGHPNINGSMVDFYFDDLIKVPLNTVVREETKVGSEARSFSLGLQLARFTSNGVKFEIDNSSGKSVLRAVFETSDVSLVQVNRIFETLCFALAHTKSWSVLDIWGATERKTLLHAVEPEPKRTQIGPPLHISHDDISQSVWKLFDQYFCHVTKDVNSTHHPISLLNRSILESGKASLDVQALTLSVTVESLLMDTMKEFYPVPDELKNDICCAQKLINECGSLSPSFRQRILGALGNMKHPRAKDILAELKKKSLIDPALVTTYGKLRNQMAHGARDPNADIQELFNQTNSVLVLFYQLVFLIVGYKGSFSDYGEYGYPTKEFLAELT